MDNRPPFPPWISFSSRHFRVHLALTVLYVVAALILCFLYPGATAGGYYALGREVGGETILRPFSALRDLFCVIGICVFAPRRGREAGDPRRTAPARRIRYWRYWQWWAELAAALALIAAFLAAALPIGLPVPIWLYFCPKVGVCIFWLFCCAVEYCSNPRRNGESGET